MTNEPARCRLCHATDARIRDGRCARCRSAREPGKESSSAGAARGATHEGRRRANKVEALRHPWRAARSLLRRDAMDDEQRDEIADALGVDQRARSPLVEPSADGARA